MFHQWPVLTGASTKVDPLCDLRDLRDLCAMLSLLAQRHAGQANQKNARLTLLSFSLEDR
jgi:hypothetical protein